MTTSPVHAHTLAVHGFDLYYETRGEGPPLLLLHGFTGSSGDWRHLLDLDELAREHRIVAPDARGHGRSINPSGTLTIRQCALDAFALLDHLGIERVRAIGVSLGGNTLLHMATQQPDRIDAMVVVAATMYFPAQARPIMRSASFEDLPADQLAIQRATHHGGDDQIRALWQQIRGFADSHDDMAFTPPSLSRITARTLIVNGDRDPLYPVEMYVDMYRAIPRSSLWIIPDGGHGPIFGEHRDAFVRTALRFLRGEPAV